MKRSLFFICLLALLPLFAIGQSQTARVGSKVPPVEVRDSNNNPVPLPYFGEKHLLIFYPDPTKANQNKDFTDYLEDHQIISDRMHCFGVINLKDAPMLPNGIVRSVIRKKEKKTGSTIYTDPDHSLRDGWGLGDVNNLFTIILVTRDREIAFLKKGELSDSDIQEFFAVVDRYK